MGMTDTATRLIKRFGQDATLTIESNESDGSLEDDPWADDAGTTTNHAVTVAVTEYTTEERANSLISDSALRVFMTAGVEPSTSDKLVIGGTEYRIERVGILGPDGTVICYELRVQQ